MSGDAAATGLGSAAAAGAAGASANGIWNGFHLCYLQFLQSFSTHKLYNCSLEQEPAAGRALEALEALPELLQQQRLQPGLLQVLQVQQQQLSAAASMRRMHRRVLRGQRREGRAAILDSSIDSSSEQYKI